MIFRSGTLAMRPAALSLLLALAGIGLASIAHADCSHADYQDKYARVQHLIAQLEQEDPAKGAALAQQVADIEAQNQGGIYDLGHTCGAYDVILMKAGK
jgi:hypothetical protein